jgi:hypothetical protein
MFFGGGQAHAQLATASISRSIGLAASSTGTAALVRAGDSPITLDKGWYTWGYVISGPSGPFTDSRRIFLDAGTYGWECDISGNGAAYPNANYETGCQLDGERAILGDAALLPDNVQASGFWPGDVFRIPPAMPPQQTYTWTSYLIPDPNVT